MTNAPETSLPLTDEELTALALAADPAASVPAEGASLTSMPSNGPLRFENSV